MSELHLNSLKIEHFRCFENLIIEKLSRVNLIVGKNSVGKTSILEAINLYATKALPHQLFLMLLSRGDVNPQKPDRIITAEHLSSLFFGRATEIAKEVIKISEITSEDNGITLQMIYCMDDVENPPRLKEVEPSTIDQIDGVKIGLKVKQGGKYGRIFSLPLSGTPDVQTVSSHFPTNTCNIIPSGGLNPMLMPIYWDNIILANREHEVIDLLKIIDPEIERLYMLASADSPYGRVAFVKTKKFDKPFQLHNHGEGVARIFGLALSLIMTKNGFLLIDEFENGLYHGIQVKLWQAIFSMAKKANIQVFATTHSWDCVEAFQEAATENEDEEAMLIRLARRKNGQIKAVSYNEEELAIATEENIEVR